MKKIIFAFLILSVSLFIISCDDDDSGTLKNSLYPVKGKWNLEKIGSIETINSVNVIVYEDYSNDAECDEDFLAFDESLFEAHDYSFINNTCEDESISGDYILENDKIFMTYIQTILGEEIEFEQTFTVINLTNKTLEISYVDETSGELIFNIFSKE
jgi:hypothetical protein